MYTFALYPELSDIGTEKVQLRLQEWQSKQDLQKHQTTLHRLQLRNLELREQLECMYEEEQTHEHHHLRKMENLYRTSAAQSVLVASFHNEGAAVVGPGTKISPPFVSHLPSPSISPPNTSAANPGTPFPMQPLSEVPMVTLPVFPVPEQYQSYEQYLMEHKDWLRWHQITAPHSLETFNIYETVN